MEAKMDNLGDTVTNRNVWKKLEEKVGHIAFFAHFHDNPLAGFPRTKFKLAENMMHMKYYHVNKKVEVAEMVHTEKKEEVKPNVSNGCKIDPQVAPEKANPSPSNVNVKGRFDPEVLAAHFPVVTRANHKRVRLTGIQISSLNSHFPPATTTPPALPILTQPPPRIRPAALMPLMPRAPVTPPRNAAAPPHLHLPVMRRPR
jgi:hypothetical protein